MKISEIKNNLLDGNFDEKLSILYGKNAIESQKSRYLELIDDALRKFDDEEAYIISAPGRSEIGGNHTDHQLGRVLATSVDLDIIALVIKNDDFISYSSKDFNLKDVYLDDLSIKKEEKYTSEALIRGIAYKLKEEGYNIGGFKAIATSNVLPGSGISSSAAFEILISNIFSHLYNDGSIDPITLAKVSKFSENNYFMKASGLLDQMAASVGGFVFIDFKNNETYVKPVKFDFYKSGYTLCLVDTKGSHMNLSEEYDLMPNEMKAVARCLNVDVLSKTSLDELMNNIVEIRAKLNDRAILRAIHFFKENDRVLDEVKALEDNDIDTFLKLIKESGFSSYMYLQNVYISKENEEVALGLSISDLILNGKGAFRVHGGGFAGTIQAFVPNDMLDLYVEKIEKVFGKGSCHKLLIRPYGGYRVA